MKKPKPIDRKAKHRILNSAGYVHAGGWINKADLPTFAAMVARAQSAVEIIVDGMERKA